jgi:hypothetical protein
MACTAWFSSLAALELAYAKPFHATCYTAWAIGYWSETRRAGRWDRGWSTLASLRRLGACWLVSTPVWYALGVLRIH